MTSGGWICMTLAFLFIGGMFGWCCWKMCDVSGTSGEISEGDHSCDRGKKETPNL